MNLRSFLNSADVADHLEALEYQLTPLELAWIIRRSGNTTLAQKHAAWREILEGADCRIKLMASDVQMKSLHVFLRRYMRLQHRLIRAFYQTGENAVYTYRYYLVDTDRWADCHGALFASFDSAFMAFLQNKKELSVCAEFTKRYVGGEARQITLRVTYERETVDVDEQGYLTLPRDLHDFHSVFAGMCCELPTPFVEGDLLEVQGGKYGIPSPLFGVFVLTRSETQLDRSYRMCELANGRELPLPTDGYFFCLDGAVHREHLYDVCISLSDCTHLQRELLGEERILLPISHFIKGEMDLADLLRS